MRSGFSTFLLGKLFFYIKLILYCHILFPFVYRSLSTNFLLFITMCAEMKNTELFLITFKRSVLFKQYYCYDSMLNVSLVHILVIFKSKLNID